MMMAQQVDIPFVQSETFPPKQSICFLCSETLTKD